MRRHPLRLILSLGSCVLQATFACAQADVVDAPELWARLAPHFEVPQRFENQYGNYRSLLVTKEGKPITTTEQWHQQRVRLRREWHDLLGNWPPLITEPKMEILETTKRGQITQHKIRYEWVPNQQTTGYLLLPPGEEPCGAVIVVYYEPETGIGLGKPQRDFAIQLAKRGLVTLSIGTTEATAAKTYGLYHPSLNDANVQPLSMLACAAANSWYVLARHPRVDEKRIGIVGHSFGGKWAMFASCLFDNFACAAWSDPGIVFDEARPSVNYWEPWYLGYHPRPWRQRGVITADNPALGLYPELIKAGRDLHELHALMAPRPFLVSGGSEDPPERWRPLNRTVEINRLLGHENRVGMTNRPGHAPTEASNEVIYDFFEYWLGNQND